MASGFHLEHIPESSPELTANPAVASELMRRAVRKRWRLGLAVFLLAAPVAVGVVICRVRPYYQARAIIQVRQAPQLLLYKIPENEIGHSVYNTFFGTQMSMVKSDAVLTGCLKDPAVRDTALLRNVPDPVRTLRRALQVERDSNTEFFWVTLNHRKREGLAYVVNAITASYLDHREQADSRRGKKRLLEEERDKLKKEVDEKRAALGKERERIASDPGAVPAMFARDPISATQEAIIDAQTLQSSLRAKLASLGEVRKSEDVHVPSTLVEEALGHDPEVERLTSVENQLRIALITAQAEEASPVSSLLNGRLQQPPELRTLEEEVARKELELANLRAAYKDDHPTLKKARAALEETRKILEERQTDLGKLQESLKEQMSHDVRLNAAWKAKELRAQLDLIENQIQQRRQQQRDTVIQRLKEDALADLDRRIEDVEAEIRSAEIRERTLTDILARQIEKHTDYERNAAKLRSLEDDLDRSQGSLSRVEQRLHQLEVESRAPGIVDIASPAREPSAPEPYEDRRIKYSIAASLAAAALAFLVMILLERRDDRIWSAEDLAGPGKAELLGSVPDVGRHLDAPASAALVCRLDPDSFFAEQVRNVTANVLYPTDGKPAKTVLITSAAPGDGKTTMAVNLAECIARIGKRVLLVDANFRKPDIAKILGSPAFGQDFDNIPGLGDILAYGQSPSETVHEMDTYLSVLTAGTNPLDPGLLGSSKMKSVLQQFSNDYDYVVIDSPPLMLADARILASMVDGVVCSFRALTSRRAAVEDSLATLHRIGARTLGVVLTDVSIKRDGFGRTARALDQYSETKLTHRLPGTQQPDPSPGEPDGKADDA